MSSAINAVLDGARKKDKDIQTFEDITPYLAAHPQDDKYFAEWLKSSGYLTVWQLNTERIPGNMATRCWQNCRVRNVKTIAEAL